MDIDSCPAIAPFLGFAGVASSIILANVGAAHGTAKAGVGIMWSGVKSPELMWRNLIPVVMAGVNGIYGLITSIILLGAIRPPGPDHYYQYSMYTGAAHLAAGLCCGLSALGSGMAIGIAGDAAVTACGTWDYDNQKWKRRSIDIGNLGSEMTLGIADDVALTACGAWDMENKKSKRRSGDKKGKYAGMNRKKFGVGDKKKKKSVGGGDKLFVSMVLIQVFAGNVGLYGLIASILLSQQVYYCGEQ